MIRATDEQIRDACATRSAGNASRYLASEGLHAGPHRCNTIIGEMIAAGERTAMNPYAFPTATPDGTEVSAFDAEMGCKRLLAAQLRTGKHWIHTIERMGAAMREAGMTA